MKTFVSGQRVNQGYYSCFEPCSLMRNWALDDVELIKLLGDADRAIGKLDMFSEYVPDIGLFIQMHVVKEATQSAKIEGTQTKFEEALQEREQIPEEKRDDWQKVQNYTEALWLGMATMKELPFSGRLIRTMHAALLRGVRGERKFPGEFRTSQNWIGGATLSDAAFVPPAPASVAELMGDIERFAHDRPILLPDLIKIAIIHYQFETIHPFCGGNGRVGRLIIPIYLVEKGLLKMPALYMSDFFERHRKLYYDNLMGVREQNNLRQWVKFFLVGLIETARKGIQTFDAILKLQKEVEGKISMLKSRTPAARLLVARLYQRPFIAAKDVAEITEMTLPSAYALISDLQHLDILREITAGKRNKRYVFGRYVDIFKD